ncbi:RdRP-domain-containing protein, partial [Aureobasidium melanogenum]
DPFGRLMPVAKYENQHEVWARIERCLRHGIDIAGRHYDWLACGNSQFRERGAYFFAPYSEEKTARKIRMSLGDFSSINIVAKCMARIGQCFSTTRASTGFGNVKATLIKDIERNGYCFTDGVGKMSKFIAQMVANELYADSAPDEHPSAIQFRMRGFKGILVVDPGLKGNTVHVRPSQRKFDAAGSDKLEIIKPSKFSSSTLNQQLILVLTSRGVPKQVFVDKMTKELQDIDLAMTDEAMALEMLQKNVDFNHITLTMSGMILDGFMDADEPMCRILLQLWRTWNLKHLKEKAKLFVEKGAFVLGCVDETNNLKMDPEELPQIFVQVPGEKEGEWKTAQGICLLARNPSLHPGDIRVVRAVQCAALKHLKNVVVLPQQGERPLANMCSGGDLDGDDYLVMWDDDLLPPTDQWNSEPMNYDPPTPVMCAGPVQDEQFVKFFIDYIKNDNLGSIATSHRVLADEFGSDGGVAHDICKELAQLHSKAVDFNKTGVPAIMAENHWPRKYPHWMPW